MPKTCNYIGCKNLVFSNHYCQFHQSSRTDSKWLEMVAARSTKHSVKQPAKGNSKVPGKYKAPAKASRKRTAINRQFYEPMAEAFRIRKKICEVCPILREAGIETPLCSGRADAVHHTRGKATIELLLKEVFWVASCFWANGIWIEENSEKAFELGLKVPDYTSKLSKFKK